MKKTQLTCTAIAFFGVLCSLATAEFRNFGNDPELAAAFRFDGEMNGGDEELSDRARAEQHYLRFIKGSADSAQRARAYVQLGVLYATGINKEKVKDRTTARVWLT